MTAVVLCVAGITIATVSFFALAWWLTGYFTRDTGTHAAPRRQRGDWDEPPGDWLPASTWPPPEVAHDEDWQTVIQERHSGVVVANVYHPTPPGPPLDYEWSVPFIWWESDTNVGGMLAITDGRP